MPPMMVMTSDTTAAKIGRSMKKRLILMGVLPTGGAQRRRASLLCLGDGPLGRRSGRRHLALGGHLATGTGALQAAHDHPVLGGDALAHDTHALVHWSELDVAARHDAVRADGVDELVGLV